MVAWVIGHLQSDKSQKVISLRSYNTVIVETDRTDTHPDRQILTFTECSLAFNMLCLQPSGTHPQLLYTPLSPLYV